MQKHNSCHFKNIVNKNKCGSSSFKMHNSAEVFKVCNFQKEDCVLDLGCGPGDYSIEIAKLLGNDGIVYAVDKNIEVISYLNSRIEEQNLHNIKTFSGNILKTLPFDENSFDVCLIITVLHTLNLKTNGVNLFKEISRILKPTGKLVTIDCKKEEMSFGPPLQMRITPEELLEIGEKTGFEKKQQVDLDYNYLLEFRNKK